MKSKLNILLLITLLIGSIKSKIVFQNHENERFIKIQAC